MSTNPPAVSDQTLVDADFGLIHLHKSVSPVATLSCGVNKAPTKLLCYAQGMYLRDGPQPREAFFLRTRHGFDPIFASPLFAKCWPVKTAGILKTKMNGYDERRSGPRNSRKALMMGDTPLRKAVHLMHCFRAWAGAAQRRQHLSREVVELVSSHLRLQRVRIRFVLWMSACRGLNHGSQRQCCAKPRNALALAQPEESSPCTRRAASQSWAMDSAEKLATIGSARTARTLDWQCAMLKSAKDNCSGALPLVSEYSPLIACSSSLRYSPLCARIMRIRCHQTVYASHTCRRASC